jgi:hypothetical protein
MVEKKIMIASTKLGGDEYNDCLHEKGVEKIKFMPPLNRDGVEIMLTSTK